MPDLSDSNKIVEDIIQHANAQLQAIPASPFSPNAFTVLKEKIAQHIAELVTESIKVSRRYRSDTVSAAHVERASEYLVTSSSRRLFRHLGTVGGIFLGAALSNFLAMTVAGQYSATSTLVSAALGIVGAFMVALHIAKD